MKRFLLRNIISFFFIVFILSSLFLSTNLSAQSNSYFLNKIGECNFVVGYDVQVYGGYAYVTNNDGVMIVDISDPARPKLNSEILTGQGPFALRVYAEHCFVAYDSGSLIVSDISDPLNPFTVESTSQSIGVVSEIVVVENYVFVSYHDVGFRIFNYTDTSLDLLYFYSDTNGQSLAIKDDFLYFGNPNAGIRVFNISDLTSPNYIRTFSSATSVWDMYIHDNLLFVGCHGAGIRIFSLNNPSNPSLLRSLIEDDEGEALGVVADDDFLYIADNFGVEAYNISDPSNPVEIAEITAGIGAAHDLDVDNEYIYVALGGGLQIFELSDTKSNYFPPFLYYVIPISAVALGGGVFLILWVRKKKLVK